MAVAHARRRAGEPASPLEVDVDRVAEALARKTGRRTGTVRRVVEDLIQSRDQRELAELQIRRGIHQLADLGVSQRDIARLVGLSQPEVSRRLKRHALVPGSVSPREVILRRAAGLIDSQQMIETLKTMPLTAKVPGRSGAYDGAAMATGTAKQLMAALQDGLLTEGEYEAVRNARASRSGRA
jgi:hypothetical protein